MSRSVEAFGNAGRLSPLSVKHRHTIKLRQTKDDSYISMRSLRILQAPLACYRSSEMSNLTISWGAVQTH